MYEQTPISDRGVDKLILNAVYARAQVPDDTRSKIGYLRAAVKLSPAQNEQFVVTSLRRGPEAGLEMLEGIVTGTLKEGISEQQMYGLQLMSQHGTDVNAGKTLRRLSEYVVSGNLLYESKVRNALSSLSRSNGHRKLMLQYAQ